MDDYVSNATWRMPSIDELVSIVREAREATERHRREMRESVGEIPPCPECGRRPFMLTEPRERLVVCEHTWRRLRDEFGKQPPQPTTIQDRMFGLEIEVA